MYKLTVFIHANVVDNVQEGDAVGLRGPFVFDVFGMFRPAKYFVVERLKWDSFGRVLLRTLKLYLLLPSSMALCWLGVRPAGLKDPCSNESITCCFAY